MFSPARRLMEEIAARALGTGQLVEVGGLGMLALPFAEHVPLQGRGPLQPAGDRSIAGTRIERLSNTTTTWATSCTHSGLTARCSIRAVTSRLAYRTWRPHRN